MGNKDEDLSSRLNSAINKLGASKGASTNNDLKSKSRKSTSTPKSKTAETDIKSAEEKLSKSMKNLSYTSGGIGKNTSFDDTKYNKRTQTTETTSSRKKVGGVVLDMDTIQDVSNQNLQTRSRRNNVIILVLSLLLAISCIYLIFAVVQYMRGDRSPACFYYIEGDVDAEWVIEGKSDTELVIPEGLQTDYTYELQSNIKINTTDPVLLTITLKVKCEGQEISLAGLVGCNEKLIESTEADNTYLYDGQITGGGTIHLFSGIWFQDAPSKVNSNNIEINITANLTRVV